MLGFALVIGQVSHLTVLVGVHFHETDKGGFIEADNRMLSPKLIKASLEVIISNFMTVTSVVITLSQPETERSFLINIPLVLYVVSPTAIDVPSQILNF